MTEPHNRMLNESNLIQKRIVLKDSFYVRFKNRQNSSMVIEVRVVVTFYFWIDKD